nr:hypothetical protein [Chloroflexota bacterium]
MMRSVPQVNEALCTRCGLCVEACACPAIELGEQGPIFHCTEVSCPLCAEGIECGCFCEEVCPTGAIQCMYEIVLDDSLTAGMA